MSYFIRMFMDTRPVCECCHCELYNRITIVSHTCSFLRNDLLNDMNCQLHNN